MSWDQGFIDREDIPKVLIAWAEDKFFRSFGYHRTLQYATWYGDGPIQWDFGYPEKGLTTHMSPKKVFGNG